jgi:hypothetical protein
VGSRATGENWKQQDLAQLLLPFHSSPALIATITCKTKQNATTSRFHFVLFLDLFSGSSRFFSSLFHSCSLPSWSVRFLVSPVEGDGDLARVKLLRGGAGGAAPVGGSDG